MLILGIFFLIRVINIGIKMIVSLVIKVDFDVYVNFKFIICNSILINRKNLMILL